MKISTFNFPDTFSFDGNTVMVSGATAINKCLETLIKTEKGELAGDPFFGSNLSIYGHEKNTEILRDQVSDDILSSISRYDSRIDVNDGDIVAESEENKILVNCGYYLKSEDSKFGISIIL